MKEILLTGAVQAFFLSLLLLTKKSKNTPDYILIILLLILGLPLFVYYLEYEQVKTIILNNARGPSLLYFINIPLIMAFTPSLFLYIKANLQPQKKFFLKNIIHYSPIFLFIILAFLFVDIKNFSQKHYNFFADKKNLIFLFFSPLAIILAIYYIYRSFSLLKDYVAKIKNSYSNIEDIDLEWLRALLIMVLILWIAIIPLSYMFYKTGNLFLVYKVLLVSLSFLVFLVAFFGFKQASVFYVKSSLSEQKIKNKEIAPTVKDEDVKKLLDFMIEKKPYLDGNLTIKQLANMINWTAGYLSKVINEKIGKNFYEFVNYYRVEEFKKQVLEKKNYTILAIALDCGFNSKSSFNRIFKQFTNLTPSQYKNSLQKKKE